MKILNCIKKLTNSKFKKIIISKFNKAIDDRKSKENWLKVIKKPDIVIFEGRCVGAFP